MRILPKLKYYYRLYFFDEVRLLRREVKGHASVLDVGCGYNSLLQYCVVPRLVGVEIFPEYIAESRAKGIHGDYVQADVTTVDFPSKSFDVVYCSEVIEHLTRADGEALLKKMTDWARYKVIVVTPNGFVEQDAYHANEHQRHVSGWSTEDFRAVGFSVHGINGMRRLRWRWLGKYPVLATIYLQLVFLVTKFVYFFPRMAFQLFAIKKLDSHD